LTVTVLGNEEEMIVDGVSPVMVGPGFTVLLDAVE